MNAKIVMRLTVGVVHNRRASSPNTASIPTNTGLTRTPSSELAARLLWTVTMGPSAGASPVTVSDGCCHRKFARSNRNCVGCSARTTTDAVARRK